MAKFLFTSNDVGTHVRPHVPIMNALTRQGHQVRLAAPAGLAESARRHGVEHVQVGDSWSQDAAFRGRVARILLEHGNDAFNRAWFDNLANAARSIAPDLREVVEDYKPDAIITDVSEMAGQVVGERTGTPVISSDNGIARLVGRYYDELYRPVLDEVRRGMGMGPAREGIPASFDTLITPAPKRLLLPDVDFDVVSYRKESARELGGSMPDGVFADPGKENAYFMYGHTGADYPEWREIFERSYRTTIEALAGEPYNGLVVVGRGNVGRYADLTVREEELGRQAVPARGAPNVMVVSECDQPLLIGSPTWSAITAGSAPPRRSTWRTPGRRCSCRIRRTSSTTPTCSRPTGWGSASTPGRSHPRSSGRPCTSSPPGRPSSWPTTSPSGRRCRLCPRWRSWAHRWRTRWRSVTWSSGA